MNEQTGAPTGSHTTGSQTEPPPHQQSGPRVTGEQMRDVDRLRRSGTDRYIAGVAGGLGRHFDVDPTIIRVVLAVLTFFGGAGLLVYAAVWLFVPEDGHDTAPIEVGAEARRIILIIAGVIALSVVFGTPFFGGGWGHGFPISLLVIGVVGVALYATRDQRRQTRNQPPPPWGTPPGYGPAQTSAQSSAAQTSAQTSAPEGPTMTTSTSTDTRAMPDQPPPAWMPPPPVSYVPPPPRPRRTGLVLFWPTVALIAIALGTLGIFDTSSAVTISAYAALAVAITGLALLVGAFVGRPGGLIALGFVSTIALVITSIAGAVTDGTTTNKELRTAPISAALVESDYNIPQGTLELDLTQVSDLAALDGRTIDLGLNAGEITVLVPEGLNARVVAEIRYAGQINVGDEGRGGLGPTLDRTLTTSTATGTPTIELEIEARVGEINVLPR